MPIYGRGRRGMASATRINFRHGWSRETLPLVRCRLRAPENGRERAAVLLSGLQARISRRLPSLGNARAGGRASVPVRPQRVPGAACTLRTARSGTRVVPRASGAWMHVRYLSAALYVQRRALRSLACLVFGNCPRLKSLIPHFKKLLQSQCVFRPPVLHNVLLATLNTV